MPASLIARSLLAVALCCCVGRSDDAEIGLPEIYPQDPAVVDLLKPNLDAWQAEDGRPIDNWKLLDGVLMNVKLGSHLVTKEEFRDFDLSLEFYLPPRGNSGLFLRGRYEVQLFDGQNVAADIYSGAIWEQIPVEAKMYKGPNDWNELQVRLVGDRVTVVLNRKPVIRARRLTGPTKGAIDRQESEPGPLLLQSLNGVRFRNIRIRPR